MLSEFFFLWLPLPSNVCDASGIVRALCSKRICLRMNFWIWKCCYLFEIWRYSDFVRVCLTMFDSFGCCEVLFQQSVVPRPFWLALLNQSWSCRQTLGSSYRANWHPHASRCCRIYWQMHWDVQARISDLPNCQRFMKALQQLQQNNSLNVLWTKGPSILTTIFWHLVVTWLNSFKPHTHTHTHTRARILFCVVPCMFMCLYL